MEAPAEVLRLVETFDRNIETYKGTNYNETQVRREFIDPFFIALGWDINNTKGYAEAYKDVIHEDSIRIGGVLKAPDYCFRIGDTRKFFIEAKNPSINIKGDPHPAFQLRRYGWSAKLPLSILTDFEEFAVYDCRIRPSKNDLASKARVRYYNYTEYIDHWDEIAAIFSRDAVLKGSFDKYAQTKRKQGTAEVDAAFLLEIERWREILAKNIALRNSDLTNRQLNFAVQKTIDRIIFLRIAEDRGLERYGELLALYNGRDVYERLLKLFMKADDRYNSGLFHFHKEKDRPEFHDELTPSLTLDDKVLKDIVKTLYYPDSPYEFSVLPTEILGHVYEQFLGRAITLTSDHRARIEEKPEVKKAGGVYYTPSYIVDYIVENTVGKLLESRTIKYFKTKPPRMEPRLTICDPACGSGSFLIGAYQYLLDWYLEYYTENDTNQWLKSANPTITEITSASATTSTNYKLTVAERKRIIIDHIYGVDIDSQAVEVTKLSLLLKVLEGEKAQMLFATKRALPDLAQNIKCGNSLIAHDFYKNQQTLMFDEEQKYKINTFDWEEEFPNIFNKKSPGFDAVIGNPPYVDSEWMTKFHPDERKYCTSHYKSASGNWDIFCVFIEKALLLTQSNGYTSMIVPNKLGSAEYAQVARSLLITTAHLTSLRDYSRVPVFPVAVYPIVYVACSSIDETSPIIFERIAVSENAQIVCTETHKLEQSTYFSEIFAPWQVFGTISSQNPAQRISSEFPPLIKFADVLGAATVSEAYQMKPLFHSLTPNVSYNLKVTNSGTIDRYRFLWPESSLRYIKDTYNCPIVPTSCESRLPRKRLEQSKTPKIIIAGMTKQLECVVDVAGEFLAAKSTSLIFPTINHFYLLGLLNSHLISFWYKTVFSGNTLQGGYLRIGPPQLRTIPIRPIDLSDSTDKTYHDKMVSLVQTILGLNKSLQAAKTSDEKNILQRQIDSTDDQIDQLVYELYDLTEEEIKIVKEATT